MIYSTEEGSRRRLLKLLGALVAILMLVSFIFAISERTRYSERQGPIEEQNPFRQPTASPVAPTRKVEKRLTINGDDQISRAETSRSPEHSTLTDNDELKAELLSRIELAHKGDIEATAELAHLSVDCAREQPKDLGLEAFLQTPSPLQETSQLRQRERRCGVFEDVIGYSGWRWVIEAAENGDQRAIYHLIPMGVPRFYPNDRYMDDRLQAITRISDLLRQLRQDRHPEYLLLVAKAYSRSGLYRANLKIELKYTLAHVIYKALAQGWGVENAVKFLEERFPESAIGEAMPPATELARDFAESE